jgi:hypothetical protein
MNIKRKNFELELECKPELWVLVPTAIFIPKGPTQFGVCFLCFGLSIRWIKAKNSFTFLFTKLG